MKNIDDYFILMCVGIDIFARENNIASSPVDTLPKARQSDETE